MSNYSNIRNAKQTLFALFMKSLLKNNRNCVVECRFRHEIIRASKDFFELLSKIHPRPTVKVSYFTAPSYPQLN